MRSTFRFPIVVLFATTMVLTGCQTAAMPEPTPSPPPVLLTQQPEPTPLPTRTALSPGELVEYSAQSGDTLAALASHFNTTVAEIEAANPDLPSPVTTLPQGYLLSIPAYYLPLTGTPFRMIPDSEVPYGPSAVDFDVRQQVLGHPGYLSSLNDYAFGENRPAWEVVETVSRNYSIHPRLLLTLLEYRTQALSNPFPEELVREYPLAVVEEDLRGLNRQLVWAATRLNNGFYGWRTGRIREFDTVDGFLVRPDPWQNAGSVAVQYLLAGMLERSEFERDIGVGGFEQIYRDLWGDPFDYGLAVIPPSLQQPEMTLPFLPNRIWDFSGGPHPSWGEGLPWGALDFAPPAAETGCAESGEWAAAPARGVIVRSENATVVLDLDGDGDERTGWVLVFFHIATEGRIQAGSAVEVGDRLGHPSCEGGQATGTHFHIARRYNGEWIPAAGPLAFRLGNWVADEGDEPYVGTLSRGSKVVPACTCSTQENQIIYELPGSGDS